LAVAAALGAVAGDLAGAGLAAVVTVVFAWVVLVAFAPPPVTAGAELVAAGAGLAVAGAKVVGAAEGVGLALLVEGLTTMVVGLELEALASPGLEGSLP